MEKRIIYKGKSLSRTQVKNNILKVWNQTTVEERNPWYQEAHQFAESLSIFSGYPIEKCAGIIAALSPMLSWSMNRKLAQAALSGNDPNSLPCLKNSAKKTAQVIQSSGSIEEILSILNGPKIKAFFLNILNPDNTENITIDRHAIAIALNKKLSNAEAGITPRNYRFIADCYRYTAESLGISPLLLQSATWSHWRNNGGNRK